MQATLQGRPGAAYVDVPSDVLFSEATAAEIPDTQSDQPNDYKLPSPLLRKRHAPQHDISKAIQLLSQASR